MSHTAFRFSLKRSLPAFVAILGALIAVLSVVSISHAADRPNIVLVMCDDLGWGDVGFNGNKVIQTPHLDTMAKQSLKFNRFYAASAVCSPTRGSVVTGRHPYRYGIPTANQGHMKAQELTLAELLKQQGYATGHFGKWHLGTLSKTERDSNRGGSKKGETHYSPPWANGFETCFSTEAKTPTYDPMLKPKGKAPTRGWDYLKNKDDAEPYGTAYWNQKGERVEENLDGDDSRVIMDRAVPFIETQAANDKPFFMIVWFHTPHLPVVAGPKHAAMYSKYESYPRNYFGCITAMDEQIGRLRATLRKAGVADNTLVTFCSDNGPEGNQTAPGSAGPFRGRKRDLFEGGVRVPGLIEWPARIRPGVTDSPAVTSDYLPTILATLGIKPVDDRPIDGIDLGPLFQNHDLPRSKPIGFQFSRKWAWSDNRYKLVFYPKAGSQGKKAGKKKTDSNAMQGLMLFDLLKDPSERTNLAESMPKRVAEMKQAFQVWQASCARSEQGADYEARN